VPKCVIFGVSSIFEVQVVSEKFSLYMVRSGTELFAISEVSVFVIFEAILLALRNLYLSNNMQR